jgi:hypothetical protein
MPSTTFGRPLRLSPLALRGALLLGLVIGAASLGACGLPGDADALFSESGSSTGSSSSGAGGSTSSSSSSGTTSTSSSSGGTTTTSSSSSGTGGSGTGGAGTGGNGSAEDCLDGADNDGDLLADCADPDCNAGFECVAPFPGGWTGYFRVREAPFPEASPPPCPPGTEAAPPLFAGPAGDAQCSACACGDVQGASCGVAALTCWSGSPTCSGNSNDWTGALADGDCHKPNMLLGFNNQLSCKLDGESKVLGAGSCPPSGGTVANATPWEKQIDACSAAKAGKGCSNGQACIPRGSDAPGESLCVKKDGDKACPDGWTATTVHAFTAGTDTRACTACSCGDPGTTCSATSYTFHDFNNCADNDDPITVDSGSCTSVSSLLDGLTWSANATLPQPSGACEPKGGDPTGKMQADGPVTFCCK